ncbi:unnamed protein product [Alopecurus aequalis]
MAMTTAELEAAIAALPAKKDALREAFDRLAACSPFPLPVTWDDLDAHISSIQSSISLRHRQLRVLEAARPTPAPTGDDEKRTHQETSEEEDEAEEEYEEVVEEVVVEEEEEEAEEVEVEEEEEEVEKELEEEEEEVDANNVANKEHNSEEEMLELEEDEVKEPNKDFLATDEADDKEQKVHKVENGEEEQEESDGEMEKEETGEAKKVLSKGVYPALEGVEKYLVKACVTMNTASLVNIVLKNNIPRQEYPVAQAVRHAKDAAALILDVVRRLLPNKKIKANKVWENCVMLIRCVPLVEPKLSVHTTEQAKQLAKDWKKAIDDGDLGYLAPWAFLYFLISYNIVSEFDAGEIIRLFGTIPRKYQRKSCIRLCKGLGLVSRISDLIDYLIGNGQELSAIQMIQVLKLVEKYSPLSLLERYVEKAKRTALELFSKNLLDKSVKLAKTKEIENLWLAHTMIKQQHPDSSRSITILEEINNLLAEYTKSRQKEQKYQKRKKEQQQHEGQDRQVQGKQRKLAGNQEQPQEKGQQLPPCKPQESRDQQRHENKGNAQAKKQKQQQQQIEPHQHLNQPRPCVTKLATPVGPSPGFVPPAVPNVAHISPIGHQPFAVMPGALQPRFPGIQGALGANGVPPQYNPFQQNPSYSNPSFYPR